MATQQQVAGSSRSGRSSRSKRNINWLWWAANAAAAWPLVLMVWEYNQGTLGIDIVNAINNRTGRAAIILLMASLACTPLNILFGWRQVLTLRKSLGLWAFAYALLHLLNFVGLDYAFNLGQIFQDAILSKPYILAGLAALCWSLMPLAIDFDARMDAPLGTQLEDGCTAWPMRPAYLRCCISCGRPRRPNVGSRCSMAWAWDCCCSFAFPVCARRSCSCEAVCRGATWQRYKRTVTRGQDARRGAPPGSAPASPNGVADRIVTGLRVGSGRGRRDWRPFR